MFYRKYVKQNWRLIYRTEMLQAKTGLFIKNNFCSIGYNLYNGIANNVSFKEYVSVPYSNVLHSDNWLRRLIK